MEKSSKYIRVFNTKMGAPILEFGLAAVGPDPWRDREDARARAFQMALGQLFTNSIDEARVRSMAFGAEAALNFG